MGGGSVIRRQIPVGGGLELRELFGRFMRELLLMAAMFVVFVGTTILLFYSVEFMPEAVHKLALGTLEYAIFWSGFFVILAITIFLTLRNVIDLFLSFRQSVFQNGENFPAHEAKRSDVVPKSDSPPHQGTLKGELKAFSVYAAPVILLLGLLGGLELHHRQIQELQKRDDAHRAQDARSLTALRDMAIDNFVEICRAGRGIFDAGSMSCRFNDGKVLHVRVLDVDAGE
jgi:hypothetical protein